MLINSNIEVVFNNNGNVYFLLNNKLYGITISNKNTISLDTVNIEKISFIAQETRGHLRSINKDGSLHDRVVREQPQSDSDDDPYDRYYFENETYSEEYNKWNNNDETVYFLGEHDVKIIDYEDEIALYDTILYNGDVPIFKTKLDNSEPVYRLKIYKSGDIIFRPIGHTEQFYKIDDNLLLQQVQTNIA